MLRKGVNKSAVCLGVNSKWAGEKWREREGKKWRAKRQGVLPDVGHLTSANAHKTATAQPLQRRRRWRWWRWRQVTCGNIFIKNATAVRARVRTHSLPLNGLLRSSDQRLTGRSGVSALTPLTALPGFPRSRVSVPLTVLTAPQLNFCCL